jgi:hypothetical protein
MNFSDLILRNFWLKFFSVALASVIWLGIHFGIKNEFSISQLNINNLLAQEYVRVPVTLVPAPGDARLFKVTPNEVVVTAVGEKTALRKAAEKSIRVYVDLINFRNRQSMVVTLHADVPPEINVLEISPATVTVEQLQR